MTFIDYMFSYDLYYTPFDDETKFWYERKTKYGKTVQKYFTNAWGMSISTFAEKYGCDKAAEELKRRMDIIQQWIRSREEEVNYENDTAFECRGEVDI